ncbi:MAG: single-stranded-DNA-specific exonuclease RecJ [candidate division WOR-3 bacterium]|nr:single-stranded-DNA-specific exonuclease RecJ [candidate division WOR-3 bacterium]
MYNNWIINKNDQVKKARQLAETLDMPLRIVEILMNRGIEEEDELRKMLYPSIDDMYDPFEMKDMEKGVKRILKAVENHEKVMIFGDYDADGITSTSLMYDFLGEQGIVPEYFIPNRVDDGYGLSRRGLDIAVDKNIDLLITVDCGITGFAEIDYARKQGIDCIVTDHHEVLEKIPNATAVINPHRYDDRYPFKYLAGCGVVLKLIQAYKKMTGGDPADIDKYLDLVALGTVADVVPLIDENRIITYLGLKQFAKTQNLGIRALCDIAGVNRNKIAAFHIGFVLAPRINAVGRMSDASEAVKLFTTEDETETELIARDLDLENRKRRKIDQEVYEEAVELIERDKLYNRNAIILANENWHEGVIGIVASRLVEKYYKPTIMISMADGMGKGSGRSIPDFHMYDALVQVDDLLESFGGHKLAAGISIKSNKLDEFRKKFEELARSGIEEVSKTPTIEIDACLELNEIDDNLEEKLKLLAPFGFGNPRPVFMSSNINVIGYPLMLKDRHMRFVVGNNECSFDSIWFNNGKNMIADLIDPESVIDIAYYIKRNNFQGKNEIQLQVKDIKIRNQESDEE